MEQKRRYIRSDAWPVPPSEIAREWLGRVRSRFPGVPLSRSRVDGANFEIPPALYFSPPRNRGGEWALVDITAAYWVLLNRWPFDSVFRLALSQRCGLPCIGIGSVAASDDEVAALTPHKPERLAVWGVLRTGSITWQIAGQPVTHQVSTSSSSPGVTGLVLATMHAIAAEAVERFGAVMWLTDAAVVRPEAAPGLIDHLRDRWGLEATVRAAGPGHVYQLNSYRIGDRETKTPAVDGGRMSTLEQIPPALVRRLAEQRRPKRGRSWW